MATYLKIIGSPAVSIHACEGGMRLSFVDPSHAAWQTSVHFSSKQIETESSSPLPWDRKKPIPTEPEKAAQRKLKISRAELPGMEWGGRNALRMRIGYPDTNLARPAGFSVKLGETLDLKPLPNDCPNFSLQLTLLNE